MPHISIQVDHTLDSRMEQYPEVDWDTIARQAFREELARLDRMRNTPIAREGLSEYADVLLAKRDDKHRTISIDER